MRNFMKKNLLIVSGIAIVVFYSCSGDLFEIPVEESKTDDMSMEVENSYDRVVQSHEFKVYDSSCANFISIMRELTNRMSQEKQNELVELASLYRSDPQKYQSLYKYQIDNFLLKGDSIRVKEAYGLLLNARSNFMKNKVLKKEIERSGELVSARLSDNLIKSDGISVLMLKTRAPENGNQKCLNICKEDYEASLNHAYALMGCATAFNIGACIFSFGLSVPAAAWTQAGIFAVYQIEVNKIEGDYERCKRRCN